MMTERTAEADQGRAMAKGKAKQIARQARRFGYHQQADGELWVNCPLCRARVSTWQSYGYQPVKAGKPWTTLIDGVKSIYERETVAEALDRAMVEHLMWGC